MTGFEPSGTSAVGSDRFVNSDSTTALPFQDFVKHIFQNMSIFPPHRKSDKNHHFLSHLAQVPLANTI